MNAQPNPIEEHAAVAAVRALVSKVERLEAQVETLLKEDGNRAERTIKEALEFIMGWGGYEADYHKAWALDQVVRKLAGDGYEDWVKERKAGEDGPETYDWDEGTAP